MSKLKENVCIGMCIEKQEVGVVGRCGLCGFKPSQELACRKREPGGEKAEIDESIIY